jgi:cell division protein FtsQ
MPAIRRDRYSDDYSPRPRAPRGAPKSAPKRAPARKPRQSRRARSGWGMKLGAWAHARMRQISYSPSIGKLTGGALVAAVAGLFVVIAALTGGLSDLRTSVNTATANTARAAGFGVKAIDVATTDQRPLSVFQQSEARAVAAVQFDQVMFTLDVDAVRARVSTLPWVEGVAVRRLWPDTVQIVVTPRQVTAAWQHNGVLKLIDANGRVVTASATPAQARGLPLVIGAGAAAQAQGLFADMQARPTLAASTWSATWTGDRRWTLKLRSGAEVLLPEENFGAALDMLELLANRNRLLDRQVARIDMRTQGAMIIRPLPESAAPLNGA